MLLKFIQSLLTGRTQRTRVGGCLSDAVKLISGVVQGSCIGPLLFILFINSLSKLHDMEVVCKLYADDVKLYIELSREHRVDMLQQSLDIIYAWANKWQLPISLTKCAVMVLNPNRCNVEPVLFLDNCKLTIVHVIKDLGVTIDPLLKFNTHIDNIIGKARSRAGLILRSFNPRNRNNLFRAFVVYVRPLLEYCSPVWSPHYKYAIDKLESVQRRFTKLLPGMSGMDYSNRLLLLNADSLERRRIVADLVTLYKILHNGYECKLKDKLIVKTYAIATRGNPYKLDAMTARIDIDKYRFVNRSVAIWNTLPSSIVRFDSLPSFKRTLTKVNLSVHAPLYCF